MTRHLTIRRALTVAVLTLAWCGLWRSISIANILVGVILSATVTVPGIGTTAGPGGIKIAALLKLVWLVLVDLVASTIQVATEIVTPTDRTEEAIIAVDVPVESRRHLLLLVVAITLTPGTAVVDADPDTGTLYLHLLHVNRRSETVAHVDELARLACEALPTRPYGVAA